MLVVLVKLCDPINFSKQRDLARLILALKQEISLCNEGILYPPVSVKIVNSNRPFFPVDGGSLEDMLLIKAPFEQETRSLFDSLDDD